MCGLSKIKNKYSDKEIADFIEKSYSCREVMIKMGYNLTSCDNPRIIQKFIKDHNIDTSHFDRNKNKRTYDLNEHYFKDLSNQNAVYWLGFIMADGSIVKHHKYSYALAIKLKEEDREHLIKFTKDIGTNKEPIFVNTKDFYGKNDKIYKPKNQYSITIHSGIMGNDLINLKCLPNKTYLGCFISEEISKQNFKHFIRGYFDGDGTIGVNDNKLYFSLVGDYNFLIKIQEIMSEELSLSKNKIIWTGTIYRMKWAGKQCEKIFKWLYDDSDIHLTRKYQKYANFYF